MKIGIIGAGHAGVAAAQIAATGNAEVTLFSNEKIPPYFRPRIPAVAFGQATVEDAVMHQENWYKEKNINLKLNSEVVKVTNDCEIETSAGKKYSFDKIIFSYGAGPIMPPFTKNVKSDSLVPLWNMDNAISIKSKIGKKKDIIIIGGGVIGLEAGLRAKDAGFNVKVIEKADILLSRNLNPKMSEALAKYLKEKGIEILTGISVEGIAENNSNLIVKTDKTEDVKTDLVVMSIGAGFNCNLANQINLDCTRKISVNEFLQSSDSKFFAAGDIAELIGHTNPCSALRAAKQGKIAGQNTISDKMENVFAESPVTLQVKYNDFSLFAIGDPTIESDMKVMEENNNTLRIINIDKNNKVVGVQMLGSNKDFKKYEKMYIQGECIE